MIKEEGLNCDFFDDKVQVKFNIFKKITLIANIILNKEFKQINQYKS